MIVTALSLLSFAFAAEPAPMTLEVPALGVTLVASNGGCDFTVVGTVPARKAGELAKATADARSQCLESQARVAEQTRRDSVATTIAPAQAQLIKDAGMAVVIGRNVRVVTPDVTVESGSHLDWQAYGEAVGTGNSGLYAPGTIPAGGDPNLYRLSGGNMGSLYLATPAVPGQVAPAATAACGTAAECQATIDAQAAAMASADK